jgi:hypothetical protein
MAANAAGRKPVRVEIIDPKGGKIVLHLDGNEPSESNDNEPTEFSAAEDWDKALSNDR